jgi:hypothetical protein
MNNNPFINKHNKKERINKFRLLIFDDFPNKKLSGDKLDLSAKRKHLLLNILIGSILIQLFFTLRTIKYTDTSFVIIALVSGVIGSCLGYLILRKYYATKIKISPR